MEEYYSSYYNDDHKEERNFYNNNKNFESKDYIENNENGFSDMPESHPRMIFLKKLYLTNFFHFLIWILFDFLAYSYIKAINFFDLQYIGYIFSVLSFLMSLLPLIYKSFFYKSKLFDFFYMLLFILIVTIGNLFILKAYYNELIVFHFYGLSIFFLLFIYILINPRVITFEGANLFIIFSMIFSYNICLIRSDSNMNFLIICTLSYSLFSYMIVFCTQSIITGFIYEEKNQYLGSVNLYAEILIGVVKSSELLKDSLWIFRNNKNEKED